MAALVFLGFGLHPSPMLTAEMPCPLEVESTASGNCDADTFSDEDFAFVVPMMTAGISRRRVQEL